MARAPADRHGTVRTVDDTRESGPAAGGRQRLPAQPLLRLIQATGLPSPDSIGAREHERLTRAVQRARSQGSLTIPTADLLAVRALRMHPCQVWGDSWWAAC